MPIDTSEPFTDGWWLQRLYDQLRRQRSECQKLWDRYEGNPPLPVVNNNQREAVKWFYGQSRTNFERLIVAAVLSRLRLRGIRTAKDKDEGGDAEAFDQWKRARGKLWSLEVHKYALAMRRGYVIVGKEKDLLKKGVIVREGGANTVIARCYAGEKNLAYGPFIEGLSAALGRVDGNRWPDGRGGG